jgi:hypothetical protein
MCIPNIISRPSKKITTDPANANDCTSSPSSVSIVLPRNRNMIINAPAKMLVCAGEIPFDRFLIDMMAGILPGTSIMANNVNEILIISDNLMVFIKNKLKMKIISKLVRVIRPEDADAKDTHVTRWNDYRYLK